MLKLKPPLLLVGSMVMLMLTSTPPFLDLKSFMKKCSIQKVESMSCFPQKLKVATILPQHSE